MVLKISKFVMKSSVFSSITITIIVGRNILAICNEWIGVVVFKWSEYFFDLGGKWGYMAFHVRK